MDERVIESRRVFEGRIVNLRVDTVELPDGHRATREIVEHIQAVTILPVESDGRIVMVRQYRLPVGAVMLELPAGSADPGEEPATAAQRELQEETGLRAGRLSPLGGFWVAPGYCEEYIHIFVGLDLTESPLEADEDERIEVVRLTLTEALAAIDRGEINDAKSVIGVLRYARGLGT